MESQLTKEAAIALITPFYDSLTHPGKKPVAENIRSAASETWRSYASETVSKGREEFIMQVQGFGKILPDLTWDIKEVIVAGNRIVVRSEASGTPAGDFMGVPHGGKSFRIMAIDIHTVVDGKLAMAHHVEDWASAFRQLLAK